MRKARKVTRARKVRKATLDHSGPTFSSSRPVEPRRFSSVQAAIDAAVSSGERTVADPALVLVLPGDYTGNVALKKHVAVLGFDRLGRYSTILRGQVTCALTSGARARPRLPAWRV